VLSEYNIPFDHELITPGNFVMDRGIEAVKILLDKRKVKFEALVSVNDDMAIGAFEELKRRGIHVPNDIALVGFDDTEGVKFFNPSITSVKQPFYEQAKKSVEILIQLINGKEVPKITYLPTHLVTRESCGCFTKPPVQKLFPESIKNKNDLLFLQILKDKKTEILHEVINKMNFPPQKEKRFSIWLKISMLPYMRI